MLGWFMKQMEDVKKESIRQDSMVSRMEVVFHRWGKSIEGNRIDGYSNQTSV